MVFQHIDTIRTYRLYELQQYEVIETHLQVLVDLL